MPHVVPHECCVLTFTIELSSVHFDDDIQWQLGIGHQPNCIDRLEPIDDPLSTVSNEEGQVQQPTP